MHDVEGHDPPENNSPAESPYPPLDLSLLTLSLPHQSASQNSSLSDPLLLPALPQEQVLPTRKDGMNLLQWRKTLIEGWNEHSTSSSSSSSSGDSEQQQKWVEEETGYGPVYGEEEDLATAIALSLAESNQQQEEEEEEEEECCGTSNRCQSGVCHL